MRLHRHFDGDDGGDDDDDDDDDDEYTNLYLSASCAFYSYTPHFLLALLCSPYVAV